MNVVRGPRPTQYEGRPNSGDIDVAPAWRSKNAVFQQTLLTLLRYARHDSIPILLEGPSGTGKTSLAKDIHAASPRNSKVFKELTLSSLEDSLSGSDLFGHVAGAFTDARHTRTGAFISATGGTLFLDEIGKASERLQTKLLGTVERGIVLQQGSDREIRVDVRIIAASNIPIATLVSRGTFLPDLAARLGLFLVTLPPLGERREDIADLTGRLVQRHAGGFGFREAPMVDDELQRLLTVADWPLNIRQLSSVIQRLLLVAASHDAKVLSPSHCVGDLEYLLRPVRPHSVRSSSARTLLQEIRPHESRAALARRLGISQATLYRRLRLEDSARSQGKSDDTMNVDERN